MSLILSGDGTVSGLAVGGLPDGTVDSGTIASNAVTNVKVADVDVSKLTGDNASVRVTKSGAQTITNNTATVVTWDVETFDVDGMHDNVTNNSRFTAPVSGKYLVGASIVFTENSTAGRGVYVRKNGTTYYGGQENQTPSVGSTFHDGTAYSTLVDLLATEYVEIICTQNSSASLTIRHSSNPATGAWMTYAGE